MALIRNGYFPSVYWASSYWQTNHDYFPGYAPPAPHVVGMERGDLLWIEQEPENFWLYALAVLVSE